MEGRVEEFGNGGKFSETKRDETMLHAWRMMEQLFRMTKEDDFLLNLVKFEAKMVLSTNKALNADYGHFSHGQEGCKM